MFGNYLAAKMVNNDTFITKEELGRTYSNVNLFYYISLAVGATALVVVGGVFMMMRGGSASQILQNPAAVEVTVPEINHDDILVVLHERADPETLDLEFSDA
jgi:hypothetical protein